MTTAETAARDQEQPAPRERAASPDLTARHVQGVILLSVLLAVAMNWQVVAHLGDRVPISPQCVRIYAVNHPKTFERSLHEGFLCDPLILVWAVAWDGHALLHQPTDFFDGNIFWPLPHSLAFTDALIGYTPAGLIGSGARAALVRYNLLFLFSYALAFAGAYLLGFEVTGRRWGAAVAGAAFGFNMWRLTEAGHLHVLSSGGIPLSLFILVRGWRRRKAGLILAGWIVATWQLSLGFAIGLPFAYLLALGVGGTAVWWLVHGRPPVGRKVVAATVVGLLVFLGWAAVQSHPYLRVASEFPETKSRRALPMIAKYSPPPVGYLAAPSDGIVWGSITASNRERVNDPGEQTLFPGLVVIGLGLWGVGWSRKPRLLRLGLLLGTAASAILALGFRLPGGRVVYRFLWAHAPGWQTGRTPGRFTTFTILGLALLAALATNDVIERLTRRGEAGSRRAVEVGVAALLAGLVLLEGAGSLETPVLPVPAGMLAAPPPQFDLPSDIRHDLLFAYWSVAGFPAIANGQSGFVPCELMRLRRILRRFPDARSVAVLRSVGINSVVLDTTLVQGTPWRSTASKPVAGLGITRMVVGSSVVYVLGRGSAGPQRIRPGPCEGLDSIIRGLPSRA